MNKRIRKKQTTLLRNNVKALIKERYKDYKTVIRTTNLEQLPVPQLLQMKRMFEQIPVPQYLGRRKHIF